MGWLTSFLPPWMNPQILGAIGIALLAGAAGAYTAHKLDQIPLLKSQKETMAVQGRYDGYRNGVVANTAKANADTIKEQGRLQGLLNAAQAELAEKQRKADELSSKLRNYLANANKTDARDLGPAVLGYLSQLRDATAAHSPASP